MLTKMTHHLILALLTLCAGGGTTSVAKAAQIGQSQYSSMVEFGDSLVDAGNYFIRSGGTFPDAAHGFFQGRNTNGYDYTDLLSKKLFGAPTKASLAGGSNFALGGARVAGGDSDFAQQIGQYQRSLAGSGKSVDPHGLYSVTFGDNDVGAIDSGDYGGQPSRDAAINEVASRYAAGLKQLVDLGARNFLITGFLYLDTQTSFDLQAALTRDLAGLDLPADAVLHQYDILDFFRRAALDPAALGLPAGLDTTTSCHAAGASDCSHYLFFDGDHPTSAAHEAILEDMNRQFGLYDPLTPVPAPPALELSLLALGTLAVAAWARRYQRAARLPAIPSLKVRASVRASQHVGGMIYQARP